MKATEVPAEVEGKLRVPDERTLRSIARLRTLGPHSLQPRPIQRLHSVYVDTDELDLARRGVALRLRRHRGAWEATAKWRGRVDGAVHRRPELNLELAGPPDLPFFLPDGPLSLYLNALVLGRPLHPILVCDTQRRLLNVLPVEAGELSQPIAEIALDRVKLVAPAEKGGHPIDTYCEVEIEQREGTPEDVVTLTDQLRAKFDLTPSDTSKFAHGISRLYDDDVLQLCQPAALTGNDSTAVALRRVIAAQLEQLRENDPGTRLGRDPEALHDMRVAIRRMRAALRAFNEGAAARLRTHLRNELRWLGRVLGAVRDLDVQLENLERHGSALPGTYRDGLEPFRRHLESLRADRRASLLSALDSPRYVRLLVRLEVFAASKPGRSPRGAQMEPLGRRGAVLVKKAFKHLRAAGDEAGPIVAPERLHNLRLRAKRARYLLEFLADITGKPGRRLAKRLIRVQDLLGIISDSVVAAALVCQYLDESATKTAASTSLALQEVARGGLRHSESSRKDFQKAWKRLVSKRGSDNLTTVIKRLKKSVDRTGTI
jgi:inorganic triphosphatase YgiF